MQNHMLHLENLKDLVFTSGIMAPNISDFIKTEANTVRELKPSAAVISMTVSINTTRGMDRVYIPTQMEDGRREFGKIIISFVKLKLICPT